MIVIDESMDRALQDQDIAVKNGFVLKRPIYALGTKVISIGADNYRQSRQDFEALASVEEEAQKIIDIVKKENRQDQELVLKNCWINSDTGKLETEGAGKLLFTEHSIRQLIRRTRQSKSYDLPEGDGVLDASNFIANVNARLEWRSGLANKFLKTAQDDKGNDLKAIFRTRDFPNEGLTERELYATVSGKYNSDCDVDEICKFISQKDPHTKATSLYDGEKFRFDILYHSDIKPENCVAGEIFKAGVTVRSSDNGTQGIRISPFVIRNLCLNLIILDRAEQNISLTHLRKNLAEDLQAAIDTAFSKVSDFKARWESANKENILQDLFNKDPREVFTKLVKAGHFRVPGVNQKDLVENMYRAWLQEPQLTRAGIVNAATRSAHTVKWNSIWATSLLEEQAGQFLFNNSSLN